MDYSELIVKRRSIRKYLDRPVPLEIIKEILVECTLAPSASNEQPWKLIIVNNRDVMKRISDESKQNQLAMIEKNPDDRIRRYENLFRNPDFNVFYNAPALVIILGRADNRNLFVDSALFAAYLMNAAVTRGLGTCWINQGRYINDPQLKNELGVTDDLVVVAPIILGYPQGIPAPSKRNEPVILKIVE